MRVVCGDVRAEFDPQRCVFRVDGRSWWVQGRTVERLGGCGAAKDWRKSVRVEGPGGVEIGEWMRMWGFEGG